MEPQVELSKPGARGAAAGCAHCGEPWSALPTVSSRTLRVGLRRCPRCGTRETVEHPQRFVLTCDVCCRAYVADSVTAPDERRCATCADGASLERPDRPESRATAAEIRQGLAEQWNFVGNPSLDDYLRRVQRSLTDQVDDLTVPARVMIWNEESFATLALPSGEILLSVGSLRFLEDEAELAFVLAHELAHLNSDVVSDRMFQTGFEVLSQQESEALGTAWSEAAREQMRLGYGRSREQRADEVALGIMRAAGYDPQAALRLLERIRRRVHAGDPDVAELAVAHPPLLLRMRKLTTHLGSLAASPVVERVNREVYRRVVGTSLAAESLRPVSLLPSASEGRPTQRRWGRWLGLLAGGLALAGLLYALWLLVVRA